MKRPPNQPLIKATLAALAHDPVKAVVKPFSPRLEG